MRVLYIHNVQKDLAEKGFQRNPLKIIEFCNAKYANDFFNADIKIGLCMPCKINVYVKDEKTLFRYATDYFVATFSASGFRRKTERN